MSAGLPFIRPYKQIGADFSNGVNFAVGGATAFPVETLAAMNITSPYTQSSLNVQLDWMASFFNSICHNSANCADKNANALFIVGETGSNDLYYALFQGKSIQQAKEMVPQDKFCFNCILRWTNIISGKHSRVPSSVKCPLCKTENLSIIYGYDGSSFQQHFVNRDISNSRFFSEAHRYRLKCYYTEPGNLAEKFNVSSYWKLHKYRQKNHWLYDWLRREIQAVTQEEDVDIIVHHILGVVDSVIRDKVKQSNISTVTKQEEFKFLVSQAVRPFLSGRSDRFVNELELFLASGLKIDAFDRVYIKHLGWKNPEISEDEPDVALDHEPAVPYLYIFDQDFDDDD